MATGLERFLFQSQRKAMPKNVQTIAQLHSSYMLAQSNAQNSPSQASTVCELKTSRCSSWIRKGRGTRYKIAKISWVIQKAREFYKNIYFCFIDYAKIFDCVNHNKLWKTLKEMGIPGHLTCLLRNLYSGQEATVKTGHGTTDWFQSGKQYIKAVYCHPAYLTSMQSTS